MDEIAYNEGLIESFHNIPTPQEEGLASLDILRIKELFGGVNDVFLIKFKNDGSGVFKPSDGEMRSRNNVEVGTFYKRERAAYLVSKLLGLNLVPPTIIREIDGRVGSLQEFIPDAWLICNALRKQQTAEELYKLWIFDYIIFNSDRNASNVLLKKGKAYAIDNGLSFGPDFLLPIEHFYGQPPPSDLVQLLEKFLQDVMRQDILKELLREMLSEEEIEACFARIKYISDLLSKNDMVQHISQLSEFFPTRATIKS